MTTLKYDEDTFKINTFKQSINAHQITRVKFKDYTIIEQVEEVKEVAPEITINKHADKKSADYLGSIEIPAIEMSDSIYKSEGDFYLTHDYNKKSYEPGEIYLDERSAPNLLDNGALLNGHAVQDGTKFGNFKKLLDIEEQPEIRIWDEVNQELVVYKMLFISLIDGGNSGIIMNFPNNEVRLQYYKNLHSTSIKQWEEPSEGNSFLLLNSCSYIIEDGHYVVVAKREG